VRGRTDDEGNTEEEQLSSNAAVAVEGVGLEPAGRDLACPRREGYCMVREWTVK